MVKPFLKRPQSVCFFGKAFFCDIYLLIFALLWYDFTNSVAIFQKCLEA